MFSLVHWGAPPEAVSLFNALRYIRNIGGVDVMLKVEGGDQQDRLLGTTHGLTRKFAATIGAEINLNSPVVRIETTGDRALVQTVRGAFEARYVIVSASPAHRATIEFSPPLPEQHYGSPVAGSSVRSARHSSLTIIHSGGMKVSQALLSPITGSVSSPLT